MKKLLGMAAIMFAMSTPSFAQKNVKAPAPVVTSFAKDFPNAITKWEKEGANYEANFKVNGKSMSALYDAKGVRQETEESIKISELPQVIKEYITKHYKGAMIKEAAIITKANGEVNYEAEVNGMDLLFTKEGKFIREAKD